MKLERAEFHQQPCDNNFTPSAQPSSQFDPQRITIRHPGYDDDSKNVLLDLSCTDGATDSLYHGFAHTAAAIVAGNRFDGFLSQSRQGSKVTQAYHELLPSGDYYFCLPTCSISLYEHDYSLPYPVFASFQDWLFPHRNIPTTWTDCPQIPPPPTERNFAASQWSTAVTVRDQCCRLTGALAYCEVAHLIPVKETAWFDKGRMGRYGMPPQTTIHNTRNLLLLRSDMHKLLDTFQWVIYPKTERVGEATKTRLVFHLMDPVPQLRELYHNVPLRETPGLRLEYLLSAFALAIFPRMAEFLRCHADRYLIQVKANAEKGKSELVTGSKLAQDYSAPGTHPSRSSNSSPSKRSRRESESPTKRQEMDTYDQSDMQTKSHGQVTTLCTNQQKRRSSFDPVQAAHGPDERAIPNPPKRIQRTIFSTGLSDEPCTCPHHLEPLALTSADGSRISVEADDDSWQEFKLCGSQNCLTSLELDRFTTLRERALYDERAKSGTEKSWTDSTAWLRQTLERGGGISPWEIKRWKWIEGGESEEQDGEEGELDFLRDEAN